MTDVASLPRKSNIWWVFLLQGFAAVIVGLMLVTEPDATVVALTTVLGFYWLITGVLALVQVFVDRSTPWIWSLLTGIVGVLAGLFVLRGWRFVSAPESFRERSSATTAMAV